MAGLGARLPLLVSDSEGPYDLLQTIKEVAAQNIKMIVFTNPGERVMDPAFGVGIRRFLFRQNTEQTYSTLKSRIRKQIGRYLPYIKIEKIYVNSPINNPEIPENFMGLILEYKIEPYNERDVLELSVSA
tara:strand:- start:12 stop:401 length:390 start_codon:yes stop_codon:yes gene_type:complete